MTLTNHKQLGKCLLLLLLLWPGGADSNSHVLKEGSTIMIENDGNTPINHYLVDCDDSHHHSKLSNIVAKLRDEPVPVTKTDDGKWWRVDLSSRPVEPGARIPLQVTKVYTHLELIPDHDVYLAPYSSIQYQVRIIKQGRPQKIEVPSERYYLVVDDSELVHLDGSTVHALGSEGSTRVRFIDESVISDEDFIQPESTIHVVQPAYLTMHILPGGAWDLKRYSDYAVEIRILDAQLHQIYPSDNIIISLQADNRLVITNSTTNGTLHYIHTLNSGPSKLVARLDSGIEVVQELYVHEPLEVRPTAIVLPWLPESKPSYQVTIYAAGATGSYAWSSDNPTHTELSFGVEDTSVAKITTHGEGVSIIQCIDLKSPVLLRHSIVAVAKIVELEILPGVTETPVGGDILLPIAVYATKTPLMDAYLTDKQADSNLVLFDDCSKIDFEVEVVEKTRFSYDASGSLPNMGPKSCASLKFTCSEPGSTRVWISYAKTIKATTLIACYKPLVPVYPTDVGVLALQTSIEVAFEGGPRPFGGRGEDHFALLEASQDQIVTHQPVIDRHRLNKDLHVFKVHCHQYGEVSLSLNVGNNPSPILANPASLKSTVKIVCAKPDSITIRPRLKDTCPLNERISLTDTLVPVSTTAPTDFELVVYDSSMRPFLNASSFNIDWALSGYGTIRSRHTIEEVNAVAGYRRVTRNFITMRPTGREGLGKIQADLNAYKNQAALKGQTLDLSSSLDIQFVDYAKISPNQTIIYHHHKNIVVLPISKGSGYFAVDSLQGARHANVSYASVFDQHRVTITPLSVGRFIIRLEDKCLDSQLGTPWLSEVTIVNEADFSREALRAGRSIKYCRDIDESMFCIYLSIDKAVIQVPTTTRLPPSTPPPAPATTAAPVIEVIKSASPAPSKTTFKPAIIQPVRPSPTTLAPSVDFATDQQQGQENRSHKPSIIQRMFAYLMLLVVTAAAITLGHKWWQAQSRKQPVISSSANSSFLRHSSAGPSQSPSPSRSFSSSTPKARPLYTERFSSTLLSN